MGDRFNALIIAPRFDAQRLAQQVAADKGWTCNWRLVEAPGIPHDHERMFNHPQCAVAMFGDAADYKRVADSDSSRNAEGYQRPPTAITKILNAPPTPIVSFSPNRKTMLFVERASYPPIEDLAAPMLRLGGLRGETSNLGAREHYVEHLVVDPVSGAVIDATAGGVVNLTDRDGEQQSLQHGAAPSYAALSWLETSILFPSKFADISVKATQNQEDEAQHVRREKIAIEEIRSLLSEMLEEPK